MTNPDLFLNITDPDPADPSEPLGVNLDSNDVSGFNFSGRDLRNWSLNGATITGATFTGADLNGAVLTNIAFTNEFLAQFTDNDFFAGARLTNTALSDLNLAGRLNFTSTNLSGATVTRSSFVDANFTNANLTNLNSICDSSNECAEITGATLNCANFDGTDPTDFFVRDVPDVEGQPGALQADENFFKFVNSDLDGVKLRSRSFLRLRPVEPQIGWRGPQLQRVPRRRLERYRSFWRQPHQFDVLRHDHTGSRYLFDVRRRHRFPLRCCRRSSMTPWTPTMTATNTKRQTLRASTSATHPATCSKEPLRAAAWPA